MHHFIVDSWEDTGKNPTESPEWTSWSSWTAIYFSWLGPELFCLLLGSPRINCWFSFAPVFQWCCSTPQGYPGVGRNTFHHSIYLWFICFPWWSIDELENLHADRTTVCFKPWQKPRARLGPCKTGLCPQYFNTDRSKAVLLLWFLTVTCSCCPYLYFGSAIMLVTYSVNFRQLNDHPFGKEYSRAV